LRVGQGLEIGKEEQLSLLKGLLEVAEEFLTEQSREDSNGQKEALPAGYPLAVVWGQPTSGDDTVQVGVMQQGLIPGVQHGREADFSRNVLDYQANRCHAASIPTRRQISFAVKYGLRKRLQPRQRC